MKKRANIADKPWTVQTVMVAVPDASARVRSAVGVLLAESGDGPALEPTPAVQPIERSRDLASRRRS